MQVLLDELARLETGHGDVVSQEAHLQLLRDGEGIGLRCIAPSGAVHTLWLTEHAARIVASGLAAELARPKP